MSRDFLNKEKYRDVAKENKKKNSWRTMTETRKEGERRDIGIGQTKARRERIAPDVHVRKRRWEWGGRGGGEWGGRISWTEKRVRELVVEKAREKKREDGREYARRREKDAKGAEGVGEKRPSAEGCSFRFGARSAFLNLCPRMPLVMPICDAFKP